MAFWVERWDRWWFDRSPPDHRRRAPDGDPDTADLSGARRRRGGRARGHRVAERQVRSAIRIVGPPIGQGALAIVAALSSWALFNDITEIL